MRKNMKKIACCVVTFLCTLLICISVAACSEDKLTMENFNKIECATFNPTTYTYEGGMTFEEVENILGKYSKSTSSTYMGYSVTAYVWGNDDKYITVSFYQDKAAQKMQYGL